MNQRKCEYFGCKSGKELSGRQQKYCSPNCRQYNNTFNCQERKKNKQPYVVAPKS